MSRSSGQTATAAVDSRSSAASPSPRVAARLAKAGILDPRIHCGKKTKRGHQPCLQKKGMRTDHPGVGACWLHGGRTPNGKKHAEVEAARNALAHLEIAGDVDPVASLFEAVRVAAWRELGLRRMLQQREQLHAPDHLGDEREDVVSAMHDRALKRRAEVAKMAVDAGLDRRMVELAEREADAVVRAVQAALDAAGVNGDLRVTAEAAAAVALEASTPAGAGLN